MEIEMMHGALHSSTVSYPCPPVAPCHAPAREPKPFTTVAHWRPCASSVSESETRSPLPRPLFHRHACPVQLKQNFVAVEGTGGAVWRASIAFGRFMCSPEGQRLLPLAGRSVLEIGSGLGLGAIVAWNLGASRVVSFDYPATNESERTNTVQPPDLGAPYP